MEPFVAAYCPGELNKRVESEPFKRYTYEELAERPGLNLDIWATVKDRSLTRPVGAAVRPRS